MGRHDTLLEIGREMAVNLPANIYVVANQAEVNRLQSDSMAKLTELQCVPLDPSEPIPADIVANASMLIMEIDPADRASLRRIAQVRGARPSLPLIVALHDANVATVRTLVRQGVNDVATIPFDLGELTTQLLDLGAQMRDAENAHAPLAPLVCVVRSTGGSGATTVLTHLAAALAADQGKRACVIDLDIQFGNVGAALGRQGQLGIAELLEAGTRLDAEFLRSAVTDSGRGFDVIVAPAPITPLETVDIDQLLQVLTVARREYEAVLIDLPANWTSWTLSAVLASTDVVLVTDLSIPGLRQAKRRLELFDSVNLPRDHVHVVVNRVEKRLFRTIGVDEVRQALGQAVYATLPAEPAVLHTAQDQGMLAGEANRKSKFAAAIAVLAQQLAQRWGR